MSEKEYEANCAMGIILNTADNLKYWVKEKNYGEIPSLLESMTRGVTAMHSMLAMPDEPQKFQGYTAEQWQEIIDGGYLVEVRDFSAKEWVPSKLVRLDGQERFRFVDNCEDRWEFCRPARIKGVMRPIFVEPADKEAVCAFFHQEDLCHYSGQWNEAENIRSSSTKYIEL